MSTREPRTNITNTNRRGIVSTVNINSRPVEPENKRYKNIRECGYCLYTFSTDYPHYYCVDCQQTVCQVCFVRWTSGHIHADNFGFRTLSCRCGQDIDYNEVKSIFPPDEFEKYDAALMRFALEKDKNVLYCPGKDCPNAFIKPKLSKTKRQCRKTTCANCDTSFCCLCGELYTADHAKMKCGPYKKWKRENDKDTMAMMTYMKSQVFSTKSCPKCKRNVEKIGGCSDMTCTNCDTRFCWNCLSIKTQASCQKCALQFLF
jgi:hypothetical protein